MNNEEELEVKLEEKDGETLAPEEVAEGENVETFTATEGPEQCCEEQCEKELPMFTQSQVNDMMGRVRQETRDRTFKYIYDRYGVDDEIGLDNMVGTAQRYDSLQEDYDNFKKLAGENVKIRDNELNEIKEKLALMESGIEKNRYDDAKFILKGKGLEVSLDNILAEIESHPEWKHTEETFEKPEIAQTFQKADTPEVAKPEIAPAKMSRPSVLGNDSSSKANELSEEEQAMRLFKL